MEKSEIKLLKIKEAAELKGISEEDIYHGIREGKIKTKQVGMRLMIPENAFDDFKIPLTQEKIDKYLERLHPDLVNLLQMAPNFGSAGLTITFHDSEIHKVGAHYEKTILKEKNK